jgi:hypothetical protein
VRRLCELGSSGRSRCFRLVGAGRICGNEETVSRLLDLKWLLIPVLPALGVMAWSIMRLTKDRNKGLQRLAGLLRRSRVEVWD